MEMMKIKNYRELRILLHEINMVEVKIANWLEAESFICSLKIWSHLFLMMLRT